MHSLPRRRSLGILGGVLFVLAIVALLAAPSAASASTSTIIAWVPSHQNDNGANGWHEYQVCGDIVQRTMALLPDFTNVLCWETGMGLTSHNYPALQSEIDQAVAAHAQILISIHNNGGTSGGFGGCFYTGDTLSGNYEKALLTSMAATTGMKYLLRVATSSLYILDPANDPVPIRVLLELGDNAVDRALLLSESGRQMLAEALAKAVRENTPPRARYEQGDSRLSYAGTWTLSSTSSASGGSFRYAKAAGSSVTATFTGTYLAWIAKKSSPYGLAKVTLDGGDPVMVDLYSAGTLWKQKVWETGTLSPGTHTITIEWTGVKSSSTGGVDVNIDALEVLGTLG